MHMDDILRRKAEITAYLDTLVKTHRRYLFDVQNSDMLDQLRKDVYICFNDICTLNTMLTSSDGEGSIKQELERLTKYSRKIEKLEQQSTVARDALKRWNDESETTSQISLEETQAGETYTFKTNYRQFLNRYLDNVGISNTSVADVSRDTPATSRPEIRNDGTSGRKSSLQNISLLRSASLQAQQEIQQLKSVLATLSKDQAFIDHELQNQQNEVQSVKAAFTNDLEKIQRSQEKLLSKLNIANGKNSKHKDIALFARFSTAGAESNNNNLSDRLAYAKDYVKARQEILTADLKTYKEDLRRAESTRSSWDESLERIRSLEESLRAMLIEDPNTSPLKLSTEISTVISQLQDTNASTTSDTLKMCLGNEIEILKRANEELWPSAENDFAKGRIESNGGITISGASPPKIGINKENITFSSRSPFSSNKANVSAEKIQKKE
ncbi:Atg23p LALA0_S03e07778g [Lachancea lanzarotensis]|uniref:LALA0S03e07778g1_1 n=1 Tax=Lachancea lanzarotensis TaxID=1245769 RepID=A0A0C7N127_9SACH|nr:uncharacterized protein LALA0_S03e07778g [Lachancea lanzarotensis]CEP61654.1 LALA0S03e07778g1_1 [Lachancea lanzarotensis]